MPEGSSGFDEIFAIVVGEEGGYSSDPNDPGNWTGGEIGNGKLCGTKYGISAAAYPHLDIENLTVNDAKAIYRRDYWDPVKGDELPAPVALIVFDAAVNNGIGNAARWLQQAIGVPVDGAIGPVTLAAVRRSDPIHVAAETLARRIYFMTKVPGWDRFGLGWARRLAALPWRAMGLMPS